MLNRNRKLNTEAEEMKKQRDEEYRRMIRVRLVELRKTEMPDGVIFQILSALEPKGYRGILWDELVRQVMRESTGKGQDTATPLHRLVAKRNLNLQKLGEIYKEQGLTSSSKRWKRLSDKMEKVNDRLTNLSKRIENLVEDTEPRGNGRPKATELHKLVVDREVLANELNELQTDLDKARQMGAPPIIIANLQDRLETSFDTYKLVSKKIEQYVGDREPAGKGGDMPQEKTFFKSAKASYNDAPAPELDGYKLVVSTPTLKAYLKDKSLLIAIRGTKMSDKQDLVADAKIAINRLASSDRYKKDKSTMDAITRKYPPQTYDYYLSGHSLGGAIANQLKYDFPFIRNSVQFNPAFQPKDLIWSQGSNTKRIYTDKDGLYQLGGKFFTNKQVVPASSSTGYSAIDAISGHVLSNFASLYGEPVGDGAKNIASKSKMKKGGRLNPNSPPSVPSAISAGSNPDLEEFVDEVDASDIYRLSEILELLYNDIQTQEQSVSYNVINGDIDDVIDDDDEADIERVRNDIIDLYRSIYFGANAPYTTEGVTGGSQNVSVAELERRFDEMRAIAEDNIPDDVYDELEVLDNHLPNFDNAVSDMIAALKSRAYNSALAYYLYLLEKHSPREIADKLDRLTAQGGSREEALLGSQSVEELVNKYLKGRENDEFSVSNLFQIRDYKLKTAPKNVLNKLIQDLTKRNREILNEKKDYMVTKNGKNVILKYGTPEWNQAHKKNVDAFQRDLSKVTESIMREFERREMEEAVGRGGADEDPRDVEDDEDPRNIVAVANMSPAKALAFLRRKGLPDEVIERILDYTFQRAPTNPTGKGSKNAGFIKMLYSKRVLKKKPEDYPTRDKKAPKKFVRSKIGNPSANLVATFPGGNPLNRPFKKGERATLSPAQLEEVRKLERERKQKSLISKREKAWNALSKPQQDALLERFQSVPEAKRLMRAQNAAVKGSGIIDTLAKTKIGKKIGELGVKGLMKLGKVIVDDLRKKRGGMMPESIRQSGEMSTVAKEMIEKSGLSKDTQEALYEAELYRSKPSTILNMVSNKDIVKLQNTIDKLRLAPKNQHKQIIQDYLGETIVSAPSIPKRSEPVSSKSSLEVVSNPLARLTGKGKVLSRKKTKTAPVRVSAKLKKQDNILSRL